MTIDVALTLLSLLSFAALVAVWAAAPLHTEDAAATAAEPASNTVPA
jgi:hypothetical protein